MQASSAETLQGLLKNLYLENSSVDAALLSSQLLQILRGASANDDDAGRTDPVSYTHLTLPTSR